jgi:hypothetical protein
MSNLFATKINSRYRMYDEGFLPRRACKPDSVALEATATISLGCPSPDISCDVLPDQAGRPYCCQSFQQSCSGWGLPGRHLSMPPVRSYRTISPLLRAYACSGLFLWHFPSGRPDQPLAGTLALRSPDFPQAAISSLPAVARRARQEPLYHGRQ